MQADVCMPDCFDTNVEKKKAGDVENCDASRFSPGE